MKGTELIVTLVNQHKRGFITEKELADAIELYTACGRITEDDLYEYDLQQTWETEYCYSRIN